MHGFVSHFTTKLDAKGRVSVPAPFRAALVKDGFEGLYCFPSPHLAAVDAGGNQLIGEIERRLESFRTLTADHDFVATALYGISEVLKIDGEGRVTLTDSIKAHAGITSDLVFVGQGYKFQIWEPSRFAEHRAEAMRRALAVLSGGGPAPAAGGA
ncbi:division/cell wall cluster transcriptional repressor MraZ [Segnochrobactrum spirostomi]|uniref:Transcriptional regulator MraZ n=1 Tax=Segnochrobactrum spirostomi TaxID=2608987 RepID=A0A6A7Y7Z4_9HYPH|nr:division/cell wall cluster transcriptional repressor MraZ [Segnochrobactrum spirostomi]MQT13782.1 division/cell wall cluster transcriptional repressor MraZ [Segnochrobactrum spirostomi]